MFTGAGVVIIGYPLSIRIPSQEIGRNGIVIPTGAVRLGAGPRVSTALVKIEADEEMTDVVGDGVGICNSMRG